MNLALTETLKTGFLATRPNYHFIIQDGEKPYKCKICGKTFNLVSRVIWCHLRIIHTEKFQRPYECDICDKTFIKNSNLNRHLRIHTGEELYDCSVCGKIFIDNKSLKCHLKTIQTRNHTIVIYVIKPLLETAI